MNQKAELLSGDEKLHRLERLEIFRNAKGLTWGQKWPMLPIRILGGRYPAPFQVMIYRGKLMGRQFQKAAQRSLRESRHWKKQELELFAAFTANQLACDY